MLLLLSVSYALALPLGCFFFGNPITQLASLFLQGFLDSCPYIFLLCVLFEKKTQMYRYLKAVHYRLLCCVRDRSILQVA